MNYFLFQGSQSSLQQFLRKIILDGEEKESKEKLLKNLHDKKDDYKKFLNNDDKMDDYIKNIEENWLTVDMDVITSQAIHDLVEKTEKLLKLRYKNITYSVWLFTSTRYIPVLFVSPYHYYYGKMLTNIDDRINYFTKQL